MQNAMRIAMMGGKRLPYDAEVEYLEATHTQLIDTGYVLSESDRIVVEVYFQADDNRGDKVVLGVSNPKLWITSGLCRFNGENYADIKPIIKLGAWNIVALDKDYCTCNGTTVSMSKGTFMNNSLSLWLFGANGGTVANTNGRISSFEVYRSGVLTCDYIPVRKDGVGYMYDRVSSKFFGNAGTGAFIIGPDKTT